VALIGNKLPANTHNIQEEKRPQLNCSGSSKITHVFGSYLLCL